MEKTLIVNPKLFDPTDNILKESLKSLKTREQLTTFKEIKMEDRKQLEKFIFNTLDLDVNDLVELYNAEITFVENRKLKSSSVQTVKKKQKIDYDSSLKLAKDRFEEIKTYRELTEKVNCTEISIPNLEPNFPKDLGSGDSNFFANYNVKFKEGNKQITVNFENNGQILLYQFLYKNFKLNNTKIKLPKSSTDSEKILKVLEKDFKKYSSQIKAMLKTHRSNAHYL
ncbi:MAG: hypothetical protein U5K00_09015 [Melioribacteraceae bacterium]|nr:hypothetical protein [Melioribacteraceae bacterium]